MPKKAKDSDIIALNSVGISLAGIASRLGCHHTTVSARLHNLGIATTDTRRTFMEDVFERLSPRQQDWLMEQLGPSHSVKDFVYSLIIKEFINKNP